MGRNRKGKQCGDFASKKDRFVQHRYWQQIAHKVSNKTRAERAARLKQSNHKSPDLHPPSSKGKPRVDALKALVSARLKDDHREQLKLNSVAEIEQELRETALAPRVFDSLQERCLYEIARSLDQYDPECPFTRQFFATFEPWMLAAVSELAAALKTMNSANIPLLLLRPSYDLTIGFSRSEKPLERLTSNPMQTQALVWQLNPLRAETVESWDDLNVDDVSIVQTEEEVALRTLRLVSCAGIAGAPFIRKLSLQHPSLTSLTITDCFEMETGEDLMLHLARWSSLKSIRFSWCCWLTTDLLATFAYQLLEPMSPRLEQVSVTDCFDVLPSYLLALYDELHPSINLVLET